MKFVLQIPLTVKLEDSYKFASIVSWNLLYVFDERLVLIMKKWK